MHGPASDLVELVNDDGYRHTAIVFHPEFRDHPSINAALAVVLGFLESPMVTGLVELVAHDRDEGAFVYPTGQCWSVAEVNRVYADLGEVPGVRAGLELLYAAGEILNEAADTGEAHGVYSHGGLTPWRVLLKPDGQALVIGHALPQVEISRFREDPKAIPREDSFRYCPPERLDGRSENVSSDHLSLALIAFELMTGKPVYDGLVNDIRAQASRGEGSRRLFRFRDTLPHGVQELLKVCFRPEMDGRHPSGARFLDEVRACLSSREVEGPSLLDVMTRVSRVQQRIGQPLDSGATMMFQKEQLAEVLGGEAPSRPSTREAWTPPTGTRRPPPRSEAAADPAPEAPPPAARPPSAPAASPAEPPGSSEAARWRRPTRSPPPAEATSSPDQAHPPQEPPPLRQPAAPARPGIGVARRPPRLAARGPEEEPAAPAAPAERPAASAPPPPPPEEPPTAVSSPPAAAPSAALPEPPPLPPVAPQRTPLGSLAPPEDSAPEEDDASEGTGLLARPVKSGALRTQVWRVPDRLSDEALRGDTAVFRLRLAPGASESRFRLPVRAPSSEALASLVGRHLPLRADPSGRLAGWWRFSLDGQAVPGTRAMADLPQDGILDIAFVENQVRLVDLEVVAPSGAVRLRIALGTAVPAVTIVDAVAQVLDLPEGNWRLEVGSHACEPHEILADHPESQGTVLSVVAR